MSLSGEEYFDSEDENINDYDDEESLNDGSDDMEFEDPKPDDSMPSRSSCQVITRESLFAAQRDVLQRVMDLLMVAEHHARTLLIHYHWDVDKLVTVFVERGKDHLCAEAGVKITECRRELGSLPSSSIVTCHVCMEDVLSNEATKMDCLHSFCNNCWTEHFIMKIREGQSRRIRCMAHKCNTICDESVIRTLVSKRQPHLVKKFDRFLLESYIEENKFVKWCPSVPHCGNAIRVENVFSEVGCTCGLQFCFSCLSEAHSPCSCLMWEMWCKKWKNESETIKWIQVNTKKCPSCLKPVEKNGGCNIVRCVCGKPFCWVCQQAKGYDHQCGRYVDPGGSVENARKSLYRYIHYYDRFQAHSDSLKLETKLEKIGGEKITRTEKELGLKDFSWFEKGMYMLFRSRRVLSHSYAFAFYMFGDELFNGDMSKRERQMKQNLFEDQQQQFEANVEKLSKLLEEPFDKYTTDEVIDMRSKVIVMTNLVNKLCQRMYDCIEIDLLDCLRCNNHKIAPYRSDGVERASELSNTYKTTGCLTEIDQPSSSGLSNESGVPPQKRAKYQVYRSKTRR